MASTPRVRPTPSGPDLSGLFSRYDTATGCSFCLWSRFHFPAPLRSPRYGFLATMDALTPARPALRSSPGNMNTALLNAGLPDSRIWPSDHSVSNHPWPCRSLSHATPQLDCLRFAGLGFAFRSAGSPTLTGRIEFVILRTDRSPPAAPHHASLRRSCSSVTGRRAFA